MCGPGAVSFTFGTWRLEGEACIHGVFMTVLLVAVLGSHLIGWRPPYSPSCGPVASLTIDPSGYVGRRTHQPWEDEHHSFVEDGPVSALRIVELAGIADVLKARARAMNRSRAAAYLDGIIFALLVQLREYKRLEVLSFAFMESLCIYGLVIALAILFANTNGKTVIEAVGIDRRDSTGWL